MDRADPSDPRLRGRANASQADSGFGSAFWDLAHRLVDRSLALGDSLRTLISVRTDRVQLAVRRRLQLALLLAPLVLAGITAIVYATLKLISGAAGGLAALFGDRAWLGDLAAGAIFLGAIAGGIAVFLRLQDKKQLAKQRAKYAELHRKFGVREPDATPPHAPAR